MLESVGVWRLSLEVNKAIQVSYIEFVCQVRIQYVKKMPDKIKCDLGQKIVRYALFCPRHMVGLADRVVIVVSCVVDSERTVRPSNTTLNML